MMGVTGDVEDRLSLPNDALKFWRLSHATDLSPVKLYLALG